MFFKSFDLCDPIVSDKPVPIDDIAEEHVNLVFESIIEL